MEKELYKELGEEIAKLKELKLDKQKLTNLYDNFIRISERNILDQMNILRISEYDGAKRTLTPQIKSLSIEQIKKQFLDESLADLVVCDINIEKTIDNMTLRLGHSRNMAKSLLRTLLEAYEYKMESIEV
jgi:hypothetical protein